MSDQDRIRAAQFLLTQFGVLDAQPAADLAAEYQAVRLAERAAIVAWLRRRAELVLPRGGLQAAAAEALEDAAYAVRRGEHAGTPGAREGAG